MWNYFRPDFHLPTSTVLLRKMTALSLENCFQVFVETRFEKLFFQKVNEQISLLKFPIFFKEISLKPAADTVSPNHDLVKDSRYKLMNLIHYFTGSVEIGQEAEFFLKLIKNRLGVLTYSAEAKLIDLIELISENDSLGNFFGLLSRRDSIIKHGRRKRIIYPERHDIGNYIYDPYHVFLILEKTQPEHELIKQLDRFERNSEKWHQELLDMFTSLIRSSHSSSEDPLNCSKRVVKFLQPEIILEYEDFILSVESRKLRNCYGILFGENIFSDER